MTLWEALSHPVRHTTYNIPEQYTDNNIVMLFSRNNRKKKCINQIRTHGPGQRLTPKPASYNTSTSCLVVGSALVPSSGRVHTDRRRRGRSRSCSITASFRVQDSIKITILKYANNDTPFSYIVQLSTTIEPYERTADDRSFTDTFVRRLIVVYRVCSIRVVVH